jgi:outer membrane protein OmpA-like peptidoglycan-associated protein
VIDPLIDDATGFQVTATRSMQSQIVQVLQANHPQLEIREFTQANIAREPLVLLGSLAGINSEGEVAPQPHSYRIWLVLADLKSGKIVGKATARAVVDGIDLEPAPFFKDSPAWTEDRYIDAYLETCGGKLGDPIDPVYLDGILTAALVGSAVKAYDAGDYVQALDLYTSAASMSAGDQLGVHSGIYLTNWQLGRRGEATRAFGRLVDYGLKNGRLAIKFLFKPGSTRFWPDPRVSAPYGLWLAQIAHGVERDGSCVEIIGHTSPTGPATLNERLSYLRAEYIESKLETEVPQLGSRTIVNGVGSREPIVGTGADDATDVLDRRVEFKIIGC